MSYRKIAEVGIGLINKANQHHQMPNSAFDLIDTTIEDAVYGVSFSTDRPEHVDFIKELAIRIPDNSLVNAKTDDVFVEENLRYEFRNYGKIKVNSDMIDIDSGNPPFAGRSKNTTNPHAGNTLVYDQHIKNAVGNISGRFKERGPYITDTTWFQGGKSHKTFREWLLGPEFGLKTIILLPSEEFDVNADKTELCMFSGEAGYTGDITVIDFKTKKEFTVDFRKIGYIINNKELAKLLPSIKTETEYEWKRTKNLLANIVEVPQGSIKFLDTQHMHKSPTFKNTTDEYITDWTDSDKWRWATRYGNPGKHEDYQIMQVGCVIPPGVIIPGHFNFSYIVCKSEADAKRHQEHLFSKEVDKILRGTRTGLSLHSPQTIWVPYATEFTGWTEEHRDILNEL